MASHRKAGVDSAGEAIIVVPCLHPLAGIYRQAQAGTLLVPTSPPTPKGESPDLGFFISTMAKTIDITGQRFGELTVLAYSHNVKRSGSYWKCVCDCGTEKVVSGLLLRRGSTKSCGCLQRRLASERMPRVLEFKRLPFDHARKLIDLYQAVKSRCTNPKNKAYEYYGGRGIKMCQEWLCDRIAFYKWCSENGYKPGLWIERKNVNGDYSPSNCTFATIDAQMNNKRNSRFIEWNGKRMTATQWERELGFPRNLLNSRFFSRGWDLDRAMTEPVHQKSKGKR